MVVTADHGEGLGDHGEDEHGLFLYRRTLLVPLVLRLPGDREAGRRVSGTAAQVDIAATLLDLVGLPADVLDGVSLRSSIAGSPPSHRVYSETWYPRFGFGWSETQARPRTTDTATSTRRGRSCTTSAPILGNARTSWTPGGEPPPPWMPGWAGVSGSGVPRPERLSADAADAE